MKVAIIGGGVARLGAAYVLSKAHDVELFEQGERAGGHVNTVRHDGLALDTGFIVHNEPNYPVFGRLLRELGIATQPSEMSFSVSCGSCGLEWSGKKPFAQGRRIADVRFLSLLGEVTRWLRTAERALGDRSLEGRTLGAYVEERGYSQRFRSHFLVPLASALWSSAPERALDFPAAHGIRFFERHGMLGLRRRRWRTVSGGAQTYVSALLERLRGQVHLGLGVRAVRRDASGVEIVTEDGETRRYDKVVLATHADQALALLADPSEAERNALGAWRYTTNEAVLHTDERFLPSVRAARASWNYQLNGQREPTVTYYLNRLQRLDTEKHYCVTLNRSDEIAPESVLQRTVYTHPLYTLESLAAQRSPPSRGSGTPSTQGPTTGTGSTRTDSRPAFGQPPRWGSAGEIRVVHGHAHARAPGAAPEHVPLPGVVLPARPGRARRGRAPAHALLAQPLECRLLSRPRLPRRGRDAAEASRRPLLRRARRHCRPGAHTHAASRPRLRLQPGHLPLVLRVRRTACRNRRRALQHLRRAAPGAPRGPFASL